MPSLYVQHSEGTGVPLAWPLLLRLCFEKLRHMAALEPTSGRILYWAMCWQRRESSLAKKLGMAPESSGWYHCVPSPTLQYLLLRLPFGSHLLLPATFCANRGEKPQSWELQRPEAFYSSALDVLKGWYLRRLPILVRMTMNNVFASYKHPTGVELVKG